jgi:hypothetical protein
MKNFERRVNFQKSADLMKPFSIALIAAALVCAIWKVPAFAGTISQTVQFVGVPPEMLYNAYLSSKDHADMTANGRRPANFYRRSAGDVAHGVVGDELRAFGSSGPDGKVQYGLTAKVLSLVPGKVIVLSWKTFAWNLALDRGDVTDLESTVVLTFKKNTAGSEIQLVQVNVPDYKVKIPDTGEVGPLSAIVNTHWNLLYWEPMKKHFQASQRP